MRALKLASGAIRCGTSFWLLLVATGFSPVTSFSAELVPAPALGLMIARGFQVLPYADAALAHDVRSLTFTPNGQVVVSGPGYIRILHDRNRDGLADAFTAFAPTENGATALAWRDQALYGVADGAFWRWRDEDGDGVVDRPPDNLFPVASNRIGGSGVRCGPDGAWYLTSANEGKVPEASGDLAGQLRRETQASAVLRAAAEAQGATPLAHGFRDLGGIDFNSLGDLFAVDQGEDADLWLPWHLPARLVHLGLFAHHGWDNGAHGRGWPRPGYAIDTLEAATDIGRSLPAGLVCYRHYQFPPYFRDGFFFCDWARGQVLFASPELDGPSYGSDSEVFLSTTGVNGFTPVSLAVAPDGSLFVATGGRHTHGGVYRIRYVADPLLVIAGTNWLLNAVSPLDAVLKAPQPLEDWSREFWVPAARDLGAEPFARVASDDRWIVPERLRAIEILTELFGGLIEPVALAAARASAPEVRARAAWSLGRAAPVNAAPLLLELARDADPLVRRCAMEALEEHGSALAPAALLEAINANVAHPDRRLFQASARLATRLPDSVWQEFWQQQASAPPRVRLAAALALHWRSQDARLQPVLLESASRILIASGAAEERLDALRLIVMALAEKRSTKPPSAAFVLFEPATKLAEEVALPLRRTLLPMFPSGNDAIDFELSRLFAFLELDEEGVQQKVAAKLTATSAPESDFHYLAVLARLKAPGLDRLAAPVSDAIVALSRKAPVAPGQSGSRFQRYSAEVVQRLCERSGALAEAVVRHRNFPTAHNVHLVVALGSTRFAQCTRLYRSAVAQNPRFIWSEPLIDLLATLPPAQVRPLLRTRWADPGLRDRILLELVHAPEAVDYEKFVGGLTSPRPEVVRGCLSALEQLPPDRSMRALMPTMRVLRALLDEPAERAARASALAVVNRTAGIRLRVTESGNTSASLRQNYSPVFAWFSRDHAALFKQMDGLDGDDSEPWTQRLQGIDWSRGDAARGEALFVGRGCVLCHDGPEPLGPRLGAAVGRYAPEALLQTIAFPSRHIAPAYRTTMMRTRGGGNYGGLMVHEGNGFVILQTTATTNIRLAEEGIVARWPANHSFMPPGLLRGLQKPDLADLYVFLQQLRQE